MRYFGRGNGCACCYHCGKWNERAAFEFSCVHFTLICIEKGQNSLFIPCLAVCKIAGQTGILVCVGNQFRKKTTLKSKSCRKQQKNHFTAFTKNIHHNKQFIEKEAVGSHDHSFLEDYDFQKTYPGSDSFMFYKVLFFLYVFFLYVFFCLNSCSLLLEYQVISFISFLANHSTPTMI